MGDVDISQYYSRSDVLEEISGFLLDRWVALEFSDKTWIRWRGNRPLTVSGPEELRLLISKHVKHGARSIYGSIEKFRRLSSRMDVMENYDENIVSVTPFIDIDILDESMVGEKYRYAVRVAEIIGRFLAEHGVVGSLYYVWSGAGIHVRVNERCLEGLTSDPLGDVYLIVEYVLRTNMPLILKVINESGNMVKVENLIAPKRVFTAPLSLHRRLDCAAIPLRHKRLSGFSLDWCNPSNLVYDKQAWARGKPGECETILREARVKLGKPPERSLLEAGSTRIGVPVKPVAKPTVKHTAMREPGRFPVMALLQAARYYVLKGDEEKAKSFGLNRAIFYAWAKYYGPSRRPYVRKALARRTPGGRPAGETRQVEEFGEKTQVNSRGYYVMGGVEQTPEDFEKQVARKFREAGIDFEDAWRKALEYVKSFPEKTLKDPREFYRKVYEPVRDSFIEKVLQRKGREKKGLEKWLN